MCHQSTDNHPSPRVRLCRCDHGTFHLTVNGVTLHLHPHELAMLGKAINTWARRYPDQLVPALDQLEQYLDE